MARKQPSSQYPAFFTASFNPSGPQAQDGECSPTSQQPEAQSLLSVYWQASFHVNHVRSQEQEQALLFAAMARSTCTRLNNVTAELYSISKNRFLSLKVTKFISSCVHSSSKMALYLGQRSDKGGSAGKGACGSR